MSTERKEPTPEPRATPVVDDSLTTSSPPDRIFDESRLVAIRLRAAGKDADAGVVDRLLRRYERATCKDQLQVQQAPRTVKDSLTVEAEPRATEGKDVPTLAEMRGIMKDDRKHCYRCNAFVQHIGGVCVVCDPPDAVPATPPAPAPLTAAERAIINHELAQYAERPTTMQVFAHALTICDAYRDQCGKGEG